MWKCITQNDKMESLAFLIYKLIKTVFLTKALKAWHNISKQLPHCYPCLLCQCVKNLGGFLQCEFPLFPSWHSTCMYSAAFCSQRELPCHQLMTVFLDTKIKLTQKIFLNRAQWLNWQCYKYCRAKVYFCLYVSMPDTVKPTVNTQTFLFLLSSRRERSFFRAILNSVPRFT